MAELAKPQSMAVTPETARLLEHWRHHDFNDFRPFFGEGVGLLENGGWDAPCLNRNRKAGFRLAPGAPGSIRMQRLSAPERPREELRALMNGDLGTAAGRGDLVRLALRLIVEEALEGEVSDLSAASATNAARAKRPTTATGIGRAR